MNKHTSAIINILKQTYPNAKIVLNYGNNWELLVSVILSAQCTDKKVNKVTVKLFMKLRKAKGQGLRAKGKTEEEQEMENFATAPIQELEKDIKSTGFYRNKAKNIQAAARILLEKFDGKLPKTMAKMLTIPGVARKTANVVLGNAYGIVEGIAVDTHVLRLSQRLHLVSQDKIGSNKKPVYFTKNLSPSLRATTLGRGRGNLILDYYKDASPEKIEQKLMKIIPKEDWFALTYLLIDHGRAICKAQNPDCPHCPLQKLCPSSRI